jgi:hypothetical protein
LTGEEATKAKKESLSQFPFYRTKTGKKKG